MDDQITRQCWENLANAVVKQAAEDYAEACRVLEKRPGLKSAEKQKRSLDRFFSSRWFHLLCALDRETVLAAVRKEKNTHDD